MTVQSAKNKNLFLCNQCDHFFKSDNDLDNHMDAMHKVKIPSEHIEQLDGHKDVSLPSANSTFKDRPKNPTDQSNKYIEEEHDLPHTPTVINPTKDGPEIKMIDNRLQDLDPKTLANMSVKELSDLNVKISRNVSLEMQLKLMPPCDQSNLKLAVSNMIKKHIKAYGNKCIDCGG